VFVETEFACIGSLNGPLLGRTGLEPLEHGDVCKKNWHSRSRFFEEKSSNHFQFHSFHQRVKLNGQTVIKLKKTLIEKWGKIFAHLL